MPPILTERKRDRDIKHKGQARNGSPAHDLHVNRAVVQPLPALPARQRSGRAGEKPDRNNQQQRVSMVAQQT